jgi:hypothetical protein
MTSMIHVTQRVENREGKSWNVTKQCNRLESEETSMRNNVIVLFFFFLLQWLIREWNQWISDISNVRLTCIYDLIYYTLVHTLRFVNSQYRWLYHNPYSFKIIDHFK